MKKIKPKHKELYKRIDEVLFYVWDPIGVSDEPIARREYENYVPETMKLVIENEDVEPISAYLLEIAGTQMGLISDKNKCDYTAKMLLEYKHAINEFENA
jgi:hypothetical protein